jgi:hypothetical protein
MIERRKPIGQHYNTVILDDICNERMFPDPEVRRKIIQWYHTAQTAVAEATTEPKRKQELERALRSAIERVTRLPPELIIIGVSGR